MWSCLPSTRTTRSKNVISCRRCGLDEAEHSDDLCGECAHEQQCEELLEQQAETGYFGEPVTCEELGELCETT